MNPNEIDALLKNGWIDQATADRLRGGAPAGPPPPPAPQAPVDLGAQAFGGPPPAPPPAAAPPPAGLPPMPPVSSMNLADISSGKGSLMGGPAAPALPPNASLEQTIAASNVGSSPAPVPPTPDAAPAAPVSIPVVKRTGTPPQNVPAAGGAKAPVFEGPSGPPKPPSASDEYLSDLDRQAKAADERRKQELDIAQDQSIAEREKHLAIAAGKMEALATAKRQMDESNARMAEAQRVADIADEDSRKRAFELANRKIDPDRYWNNKGTGGKILAGIGILLSGLGQGMMRGGPNMAMQVIQAGIDRDIAAQRADIDNAKDANAMLDKISQKKYGRSLQMHELEARTRLDGYNYALAEVDNLSAKYDDPIAQAKLDKLKVDIQQEADKTKNNLAYQTYQVKQAQEQLKAQQELARLKASQAGAANVEKLQKEYRDRTEKLIEKGYAPDKAQAMAYVLVFGDARSKSGQLPGNWRPEPKDGKEEVALAGIPKSEHNAAIKEREEAAKAQKALSEVDGIYSSPQLRAGGPWDRDREASQARLKAIIKEGSGKGNSSDKDFEAFVAPMIPSFGESDETWEHKKKLAQDAIRANAATPTWDRYGLNPMPQGTKSDQADAAVGAKPRK